MGNPKLYERSREVLPSELASLKGDIRTLHGLILEFRQEYGAGRGIAAPQIGLPLRIICLNLDGLKHTLLNPVLDQLSPEMFEVWDDCMSFPDLHVKVERHLSCRIRFRDEAWKEQEWILTGDHAELIQHEYDHLEGILATQRAIDGRSFRWV